MHYIASIVLTSHPECLWETKMVVDIKSREILHPYDTVHSTLILKQGVKEQTNMNKPDRNQ